MTCIWIATRIMLATALYCVGVGWANAQDFPNKLTTIVVPNSPGGSQDIIARLMAPEMSKVLGQTIIVENKPGAEYTIGLEYVAKQAPADGHTLTVVALENVATLPFTIKNLRFDPLKDLTPVIVLTDSKLVLTVTSQRPWASLKEMIEYAKANPGKLNYATTGPLITLLTEALDHEVGIDVVRVPFSGFASMLQALMAGNVDYGLLAQSQALSNREKLRPLAQSGDKRSALIPDIPTFAELGVLQVQSVRQAFFVRLGTPKLAMDKIFAASSTALQQQGVSAGLAKAQMAVAVETPERAKDMLAAEAKLFATIAKAIKMEPQ